MKHVYTDSKLFVARAFEGCLKCNTSILGSEKTLIKCSYVTIMTL